MVISSDYSDANSVNEDDMYSAAARMVATTLTAIQSRVFGYFQDYRTNDQLDR